MKTIQFVKYELMNPVYSTKTIRLKTSIMFALSRALSFFIDYIRHGFLRNENNSLKLFPF